MEVSAGAVNAETGGRYPPAGAANMTDTVFAGATPTMSSRPSPFRSAASGRPDNVPNDSEGPTTGFDSGKGICATEERLAAPSTTQQRRIALGFTCMISTVDDREARRRTTTSHEKDA